MCCKAAAVVLRSEGGAFRVEGLSGGEEYAVSAAAWNAAGAGAATEEVVLRVKERFVVRGKRERALRRARDAWAALPAAARRIEVEERAKFVPHKRERALRRARDAWRALPEARRRIEAPPKDGPRPRMMKGAGPPRGPCGGAFGRGMPVGMKADPAHEQKLEPVPPLAALLPLAAGT